MNKLYKILTLTGISGNEYEFTLYSFDDFDELSEEIDEARGALYLFTKRHLKNGQYFHDYIYLGETSDISTRYGNHHKKECIMSHRGNCIGFYYTDVDDDTRKAMEKDILDAYDFPCNDMNN